MWTRRGVIMGSASLALAACGPGRRAAGPPLAGGPLPLAPADDTYRNEIVGYGALVPDPAGIFDLPQGFSYKIISRFGDRMDDGFAVPDRLDGMGSVDIGGGRVALIRNHELPPGNGEGPAGTSAELRARLAALPHYGGQEGWPHPGGTTTIVYDYKAGRTVSTRLSLSGTIRNCAGGVTPWGSWLSCEETVHIGDKPHGWVFEVPAAERGLAAPVPLKGLGRFNHEAAIVHPGNGVVYQTEDRADGLFYRFLPAKPGSLASGGRLQALAFVEGSADTRNWTDSGFPEGSWRDVRWIDLEDIESAADDLRKRGAAKGAAVFARGEGIHIGTGEIYFACTSGGHKKIGQIMRYVPSRREGQADEASQPGRLQLFSESDDDRLFSYCDNIAVAPWNHLVVCEDKGVSAPVNHLKGITPSGKVYAIGRNAHPERGELAGVCFSPDARTMFFNIYHPGMTLAVTGPWKRVDTRQAA